MWFKRPHFVIDVTHNLPWRTGNARPPELPVLPPLVPKAGTHRQTPVVPEHAGLFPDAQFKVVNVGMYGAPSIDDRITNPIRGVQDVGEKTSGQVAALSPSPADIKFHLHV